MSLMLLGRQRGEEKRLEVKRGGRRAGEQGTGNHRYVQDGGWVAWREDRGKVGLWRSERTASYWSSQEEGNTHMSS